MKSVHSITSDPDLQDYLSSFAPLEVKKGWLLHEKGAVLELEDSLPSDPFFRALLSDGGTVVNCDFGFNPLFGWDGDCDCPVEMECRHIFAAVLKASSLGLMTNLPFSDGRPLPTSGASAKKPRARTMSILMDRLEESYQGKPPRAAVSYVSRIQQLFRQIRDEGGAVFISDLKDLGFPLEGNLWRPVELGPHRPATDFDLWLYLAWMLREQGVAIPSYMEGITDLSVIEPIMRQWKRGKEILLWQDRLESASGIVSREVSSPIDLRIVIHPKRAQLQWRTSPEESFKDLKASHSRELAVAALDPHKGGALFHPEAGVVWNCCRDTYGNHARTDLKYEDAAGRAILNQLLRMPALSDRVVTQSGQPLARSADPLRYALQPALTVGEDYRLRLVRSDGSPAPEVLVSLPGTPPLYLTAEMLFEGPPAHPFDDASEIAIPAPALETQAGVNVITALGVALPPRIEERAQRVASKVKIYCDISLPPLGGAREIVLIRALSETPGRGSERFGVTGWSPERNQSRKAAPASKGDQLLVIDESARAHVPRLMHALDAKWQAYLDRWEVRLTKNFPESFIPWLASVPPEIEVLLDPELASLRQAHVSGSVRLEVEESGVDWFNLQVVLDVAETELTPEEVKILLNAKGNYVRLGKKGWRRLQFHLSTDEEEQMARIGLDARDFTAEPQRLHALQLSDETAAKLLPPQQVEKIQRRAGELKARVAPGKPAVIQAELRPYQVEGFHFLAYLSSNRFGGVLADDMGLGKTLQTLTWLAWLRAEQPKPKKKTSLPSLVVCPKSVMDNWESEAKRFLPELRVHRWQGEGVEALEEARGKADLIVLNYAQLRTLSPGIAKMKWLATILDEAQYIKNPDSQTAQVARALQSEHRLALTGTPIENRLLDLWSILSYAMPGVLGNRAQFTRSYGSPDDPFARRRLAARVRPFLLRRTKNQVARDLPDRTEEDLHCELEGQQRTLYRAELKRAQQLLLKVQTKQQLNESRFNILTSLLRLRQICCHPALVDGTLSNADSAKVLALVDLLEPLMEEGHKVLVFSQFVGMLEILRDTLKQRDWSHFYLAGDTEDRGALVNEFQSTKGSAVFLISLKAGGFGLNLTAASYVVLFDPWWNPAVESQAIDRTHRIGQTSKVIAYRLLIKDTIEEKIRALQKTKAALADDVFGDESFAKSLTLEDLRYLLSGEG